jgi:hypothetical protein
MRIRISIAEDRAEELEEEQLRPDVKGREDEANRRLFALQIVQPGLAGLMDGPYLPLPRFSLLLWPHQCY